MKKRSKDSIENLKSKVRTKAKSTVPVEDRLSSGSTLLNMGCSGSPNWAFAKGGYYFLVGDSNSGKTFLTLTCLAEAASKSSFDNFRFILNDVEAGSKMDFIKFFGEKMAKRIEVTHPETIEDWYYECEDDYKKGTPVIRILDSMDSLMSQDEEKKFAKQRSASKSGKEEAGSFGDGKAKKNSQNIRRVLNRARRDGSIIIVISQSRDSIGYGAKFEPKTRSGGRALKFYANLEIWTSVKGKIKKTVRGKPRRVGTLVKLEIKKNRFTGNDCKIETAVPIHRKYGIDDISSCVQYLLDEGHWKMKGGVVDAEELGLEAKFDSLVKLIEEEQMEKKLRTVVGTVWKEIEEACDPKRKPRYE